MAIQALSTLLPLLYLVLALLHGMEFAGPRAPKPHLLRWLCFGILLLAHVSYLGVRWQAVGHMPVTDFGAVAGALALSIVILFHLVALLARSAAPGVFVLSFAFLLILASSCFGDRDTASSELAKSPFFVVHITTAIVASASLFLSGSFGGLYLLLLRRIRTRSFGTLFQGLPDLQTLARLNRHAAAVGFVLLSIGINAGIWWAHSGAVSKLNYMDAKVLPWIILWLIFGLIAVSRVLRILSDRKIAWFSFLCAACMMLLLAASFLPMGMIHRT